MFGCSHRVGLSPGQTAGFLNPPSLAYFGSDLSHPCLPLSPSQVSVSPDPSSPREEEGTPLLPRTRLQAGPRQHRRRALTELAAQPPAKAAPPGTLGDTPLLLELQKLPGLANTDLSAPNPNIQVRACKGPWAQRRPREELGNTAQL